MEDAHTVEGLLSDIAKYRERLEVDRAYTSGPGTPENEYDTVFFDYRGFENEEMPDGIEARDCTIKLQDEYIKKADDTISRLQQLIREKDEALEPFDEMRASFLEGTEDYGDDEKVTVTCGRSTYYGLTLGDIRRTASDKGKG